MARTVRKNSEVGNGGRWKRTRKRRCREQSNRHCWKNEEVPEELGSRESQVLPLEERRSGGWWKRSHPKEVSIVEAVNGTVEEILSSMVSIVSKRTHIGLGFGLGK